MLGPLDLITSKLARGDDADLDDVEHLIRQEALSGGAIRAAVASARVPDELREHFRTSQQRLEDRLLALGL